MKITAFSEQLKQQNLRTSFLDRFARNQVFNVLQDIENARLTVTTPQQTYTFGDRDSKLHGVIEIKHDAFYRMVMLRGSIGAAEAYMLGCWDTPNLTDVVRVLSRNIDSVERMDGWLVHGFLSVQRLKHKLAHNDETRSRQHIHAHYDLGNQLFAPMLDSRMMYSSAIYQQSDWPLERAAEHKLQVITEKLAVNADDHVLEIGTGWGGMAIYLAQHTGCRVTTTTISEEQFAYATDLVERLGLQQQVTVLDKDYRDLRGSFDKIVSVEMIEAVGHQYFPAFFKQCETLLAKGGRMLLQTITIPDQRYDFAKNNIDFIQRYIFPGGCLPSLGIIIKNLEQHTSMQLAHLQDIGLDYAQTLSHWRDNFMPAIPELSAAGYDTTFFRLWQFYLSYCEGGFRERAISTVQLVFHK